MEYLENSSNAIIPDLPIEEPDNSLNMGDEHLSTIPEMESDEVIKSSVEDLVPIPSESKGISDDTCDVPFCDNSPPFDVLNNHFEIFFDFNDDYTSRSFDHGDDKLHFVEEPVEIMDREVKQLRRSRVPIVKVRWNSRRGPEFTWEREDQFRKKYPHLFTKTAPSSSAV
ncbi:hypothetical protein Tco_0456399 [Tanacetum coccineum]